MMCSDECVKEIHVMTERWSSVAHPKLPTVNHLPLKSREPRLEGQRQGPSRTVGDIELLEPSYLYNFAAFNFHR